MRRLCCYGFVLAALAGCGASEGAPRGTGADAAAVLYFRALAHNDWPQAREVLDTESAAKLSAEKFSRLAGEYQRKIGFAVQNVSVRACDENGSEAVAHVVISGASSRQRFKDAVSLRKQGEEWKVVLPSRGR